MKNLRNLFKFKSLLRHLFVPFVFVLISFVGCLSCIIYQDFQLDSLSYEIIDYNKILGNSEYNSPILSVAKSQNKIEDDGTPYYNDLFSALHYNMLVKGARTIVTSKTSLQLINSEDITFPITLTTQPTFSVDKEYIEFENAPLHHIDSGQHYSYFPEIVNRHRGDNLTSFMYISDTLANKIIEKLNVPGDTLLQKYENLILNEEYCFQNLLLEDGKIYPVAINNILHTNYDLGQSARINELYGDFSLIWMDRISKNLDLSFEVDLKTNPYGNKNVIKTIEKYGYTVFNSTFLIKTLVSGSYSYNDYFSTKLSSALSHDNSTIFYVLFVIVQALSFCFCFFVNKLKLVVINNKITNLILIILFCIYGLVVTYTYCYPLFSITPLVFLFFWFAFYLCFNNIKKTEPIDLACNRKEYYEIEI